MADEKKKEPVKYKFGEQEFDLERYIKNIDANAASYMEKLNWNEDQKREFMNAYNQYLTGLKDLLATGVNRFSTNTFGSILDSQGLLSNTDNDDIDPVGSEYYYDDKGNKITTDDYKALKKRKQKNYLTFLANREVATYFNKVGRSLLEKMETEAKPAATTNDNAFDFKKHGFVKWWGDKYNPAGGAFDGTAILELDLLVDGKRARTERSARLALDFTDYMGSLSNDLDFSKTRFKDKAGYTEFLNKVITKINDGAGLEENDLLDLGLAGVGRDFLEPFLSTDKTVAVSTADRAAEEAKKKAEAEALQKKEREDAMRKFIEEQRALAISNIGLYHDFVGIEGKPKAYDTILIPYSQEWYNPENGSFDRQKWKDSKSKDSKIEVMLPLFLENPFDTKWGHDRYVFLKTMINSGLAIPITNNASLQGFYYIPRVTDRAKATALVYNPSTQQMFETFIGNTSLWDSIMSDFKREQNWIDPTSPYMRKEGGVLYMQEGGTAVQNAINYWYLQDREELEQRAKKEGRTAKLQKAAERYINGEGDILPGDNSSMANPDAGFTSGEWARLASGAADIASTLMAWAPGAGTAGSLIAGLGSTAGNLYADIIDDSVSAGRTAWNALTNVGMDLVGLIPGGGAAGKFTKIGRNIIHLAPKMIAALGTFTHLANVPEYIASWEKLGTDDKLTDVDWMNIMNSIQAVLGPAAGVGQYAKNKGYYGNNKAEAAKRVDAGAVNQDKVAVRMLDKNGKEQTVLFTGDDAIAIRKAQESGKLEDLKAATIDKFQDLEGWSLKETDLGFRRPQLSVDLTKGIPFGHRPVTPNDLISDVITRQGVDFARVRGFHDDITSFHSPGRRWEDIDNDYIEAQLLPLASKSAAYDRMLRMKGKAVADYDSKIATADADLASAKASGSNKTSAELDAKLQQMRKDKADGVHTTKLDEITNSQTNLTLAQKELVSIEKKIKRLERMELAATSETTRTAIRSQIEDAKVLKATAIKKAEDAQKIIDDNTKWLADNDDAKLLALESEFNSIKALEDAAQTLKTDKAKWNKYTDTGKTKLREDFETNYPVDADGNITVQDPNTGRKITRNFKLLLDKYGIKHKRGGVLKANGGVKVMNREGDKNWLSLGIDNTTDYNKVEKWDGYYNMDGILKDLKYDVNIDPLALLYHLNNLESVTADFSNKEVNKTGYNNWNVAFDKTGMNKYFGKDTDKFNFLGPSTWNRNALIQKLKGLGNVTVGGTKIKYADGKWQLDSSLLTPGLPEETKYDYLNPFKEQKSKYEYLGYPSIKVNTEENEVQESPAAEVPADDKKRTMPTDVLKKDQNNLKEEKSPWHKGFVEKLTNDTFLKYSVPRALFADITNRNITKSKINAEKAFYQDPFQVHRAVESDLDAEAWGQRASAMINNLTSKMLTSDFGAYLGLRLEGFAKGLDHIILGKEKSNQAGRASKELSWQQEKENAKNVHDTAQLNVLSAIKTDYNKNSYWDAFLNKQHEIWDTLWKEKQFKEEEEIKKNEAYADAFTKTEISDYVTSNLATLDPKLLEDGIKLYLQVKKGLITPSSLSADPAKYKLFMEVADAASKLEQEEFKAYKGINTKWTPIRRAAKAKEGTKLKILNSRVRTKNADRFAKQLKSDLDRNDKALARLSKSIYSYIKGLMV